MPTAAAGMAHIKTGSSPNICEIAFQAFNKSKITNIHTISHKKEMNALDYLYLEFYSFILRNIGAQ